jgi:hypothetical protein
MRVPDPRKRRRPVRPAARSASSRAPRELVAAIIGVEVGIGVGLLLVGGTVLAPLGFGALGAGIGAVAVHTRNLLVRRWLRAQLRAAR